MKGRTVSLVIALVLLNYLIFSTIYSLWGGPKPPQPTPTRTPKPTYTRGAEVRALYVTATATERPAPTVTDTPSPVTPSATPTLAPTNTPAPTQPPATNTAIAATLVPVATAVSPTAVQPTAAPPSPISTTPAPTLAPSPVGTSFIHVVVAGESLTLIAQKYGVSIQAIVDANGLKSANQVYIGQRLIIPTPSPTATPGATQRTHTVKAGEVLSSIARLYGVTMEAIMKANNLTNPDRIYAGQVLIIP